MDKTIEAYIKHIVSELNCSEEEKNDTAEEMKDHVILLRNEYIDQGFSHEEATQKALQSFGDEKNLREGFLNSFFPYYKFFRIGAFALFSLYSFVVVWNLLLVRLIEVLKHNFNSYYWVPEGANGFFNMEVWNINSNIIPFHNIYLYLNGLDKFNLDIIIHNTLGNILIFVPLGIFLPVLFKSYKIFSNFIKRSILITFIIEASQLLLHVGQFDIDDILLNVIGCLIGYSIIRVAIKISNYIRWNVLRKTLS